MATKIQVASSTRTIIEGRTTGFCKLIVARATRREPRRAGFLAKNVGKSRTAFDLFEVDAISSLEGTYTMIRFPSADCQLNAADSSPLPPIDRWPKGSIAHTFFSSSWWTKAIVAMMVWIGLGLVAVPSAAPQHVASGTIELSGGSLAAGVGYTWGSGTLIFQGKEYPLTVHGISMMHVSMSNYIASGTVYNLTKPSDINGLYKTVSVEPAGSASTAFAIKNSSGVLIEMTSTQPGLNFNLGPHGLALALR